MARSWCDWAQALSVISRLADAVAAVEGERALEGAGDAGGALVAVDLGVGEPGVVVDDRVDDVDAVAVLAVLA